MIVVGVNSYFEHPSVAVIDNGSVVHAVEDERFTGVKHGCKYSPHRTYLPVDALYAAFRDCGIDASDVDEIAYSYNRWDHLGSLWGCFTGRRISSLRDELAAFYKLTNVREALKTGYEIPTRYRDRLDPKVLGSIPYREWNHHLSHAASTFFCSGFSEALVVVSDGSGEHAATSVYIGKGSKLRRIASVELPHSLGIYYSVLTKHLGFEPFSDEFKVMGLAAYGMPTFASQFGSLLRLERKGSYSVDVPTLRNPHRLLGPARMAGEELTQRHMDIARSGQERLEIALEHVVGHHLRSTGLTKLCLAGGTFMNCVANGRLARLGGLDDIFVQPASHDAGTAVGAGMLSYLARGGRTMETFGSASLGTAYGDDAIAEVLTHAGLSFERLSESDLQEAIATRLASDQVGGLFRGRMEFGSRALGMRSLLASPTDPDMRNRLNRIKGREGFRPVAPLVTGEAFDSFFDGHANRYMLFTAKARERAKLLIPAAVHADGTSRVQTIRETEDPFMHALLRRFEAHSGVPVVINTSLNVRGKPIVESPQEALSCLFTTDMDFLAIGSMLVDKNAGSRAHVLTGQATTSA